MTPYRMLALPVLAALLAVSFFSSTSSAQGVTWAEESSFEIPALGRLGRMLTNKPVRETYYLTETMSCSEQENQVNVVDLTSRSFLFIDHEKKEYTEMTFDEMTAMFERRLEEVEQNMEEAEQQAEETREEGHTDVQYDFKVDAEATGESKQINGYDADQLLITMQVIYDAEHTDEEGETQTASGNFFVLVDSWRSDEAGSDVEEAFMRAYAEAFGQALVDQNPDAFSGLQQAFEQDPRIGPALERIQEEQRKAPGTEVMSKAYFLVVPEGQEELDVDAVLGTKKEEEESGTRRRLGRLARRALGDRGNDDGGDDGPEQSVLFVVTTERKDFSPWSGDGEQCRPRESYRKVEMGQ